MNNQLYSRVSTLEYADEDYQKIALYPALYGQGLTLLMLSENILELENGKGGNRNE